MNLHHSGLEVLVYPMLGLASHGLKNFDTSGL
jgi:hypothetical protein